MIVKNASDISEQKNASSYYSFIHIWMKGCFYAIANMLIKLSCGVYLIIGLYMNITCFTLITNLYCVCVVYCHFGP